MGHAIDSMPGATPELKSFVGVLRAYMRDHTELNRLIAGEETNDRMLAWAVLDAVNEYNAVPPFTHFTLKGLMQGGLQSTLLRLATIATIESVGLLQTRNHLNYSSGGINVGVNDKTPMLMQWLQYFTSRLDQRVKQQKIALNISSVLGEVGVHSELLSVNASYLDYVG